jgi:hypothetical protein
MQRDGDAQPNGASLVFHQSQNREMEESAILNNRCPNCQNPPLPRSNSAATFS